MLDTVFNSSRRRYSDRERAEVLALHDSGIPLTELARQTGIPDSTISQWINGRNGLNHDTPYLREQSKKTLADKFEQIAEAYIEQSLKKQSVSKTSGYYAVKAANEAVSSMRLLREQPTEIHGESGQSAREIFAKQYQQEHRCSEAEAEAAAELAFKFKTPIEVDQTSGEVHHSTDQAS